jgi:hypothetical protein
MLNTVTCWSTNIIISSKCLTSYSPTLPPIRPTPLCSTQDPNQLPHRHLPQHDERHHTLRRLRLLLRNLLRRLAVRRLFLPGRKGHAA